MSVVDAPTVVYIPYKIHFIPKFEVWSTGIGSNGIKENQLLNWYPDHNLILNQLIIVPSGKLDISVLPSKSKALLEKSTHTKIFSECFDR